MTNEEAINIIQTRLNTYYCTDEDLKALDLAIKALEDRPTGEWLNHGYDDFDDDTLITLARIAVIRSIIEGLYYDIDALEYLDNAEATSYITTVDDKLKQLRDYIVKEANKNE